VYTAVRAGTYRVNKDYGEAMRVASSKGTSVAEIVSRV
jgi:hypothetical protein